MSKKPGSGPGLQVKGHGITSVKSNVTPIKKQVKPVGKNERALKAAFDALIDQHDHTRPETPTITKLVEEALETGEPDSYLLMGLLSLQSSASAYDYLEGVEKRGCTHPLLYYHLGVNYSRDGPSSNPTDINRPIQYFLKAIEGGCTRGYYGIFTYYTRQLAYSYMKIAHTYMLQLEMLGIIDASLFTVFAEAYRDGLGRTVIRDRERCLEYYNRACHMNYIPAFLKLSDLYEQGIRPMTMDRDKALTVLLDAVYKQGINDDRIDMAIANKLYKKPPYGANDDIIYNLGFTNREDMINYYDKRIVERGGAGCYAFATGGLFRSLMI